MALSEYEQQMLAEMERRLYASEADSVQTSKATQGRPSYRALVVGIIALLAGVGILIAAVSTGFIWLGLVGFVVMLGGVLFMIDPKNRVTDGPEAPKAQRDETFAERAERRWNERMEGDR